MTSHETGLETVSVQLTQLEGRELLECLGGLIAQVHTELNRDELESAQERLGDANALAMWLRENVTLELPPSQATRLLEALLAELQEDREGSEETRAALTAVKQKLSSCLPSELAAKTIDKSR